jgi:lysophospholipase L1-like esterase
MLRDAILLVLLGAPTLACGAASASDVRSIAAMGDSLTQAYFSDGTEPPANVPANSWATGGAGVKSHRLRLQGLRPGTSVSSENYAVTGRLMSDMHGQAGSAVNQGADYVTILAGTNDLCEPSVAEMTSVPDFTTQFRSALSRLVTGLPDVKILVGSIPNWHGIYNAFKNDSAATNAWASYYGGLCRPVFGASTSASDRETARRRLVTYNRALRDVCAEFSNCTYDNGVVFRLPLGAADLAPDFFHLSARGQARLAAATWAKSPARPTGGKVAGTRWNDLLLGHPSGDLMEGLGGRDVLVGGGGADRLAGGLDGDVLKGGSGSDLLSGGPGRDRILAGAGRDRIGARDGDRETINCGSGADRVVADRTDIVDRNCESVARR